jgi:hypothetical protein
MSTDWSAAKYRREAKREPARLKFWLQYHDDIDRASRDVCDNPPGFDEYWRQMFPNAKRYRAQQIIERRRNSHQHAKGMK